MMLFCPACGCGVWFGFFSFGGRSHAATFRVANTNNDVIHAVFRVAVWLVSPPTLCCIFAFHCLTFSTTIELFAMLPVLYCPASILCLQPSHDRWITLSFGATQTVAGILMALTVIFTFTGERFASLKVCWKTSQRVKFREYSCLTRGCLAWFSSAKKTETKKKLSCGCYFGPFFFRAL